MQSVFAEPGLLTYRGKEYPVPAPTPKDLNAVAEKMRELARAECVAPLLHVSALAKASPDLHPAVLAEAVRQAVAMGSGGGTEPTAAAIARAYDSLEGVRFQFWYFAKKSHPDLTQKQVEEMVGDDDRYDLADAIFRATKLPDGDGDPKA